MIYKTAKWTHHTQIFNQNGEKGSLLSLFNSLNCVMHLMENEYEHERE